MLLKSFSSVRAGTFSALLRVLTCQLSESVATGLNDDKGFPQLFLGVRGENSCELLVNNILGGGQYAQVQDTGSERVHEYQSTKISISGHKKAGLSLGNLEEVLVLGLCEAKTSDWDSFVAQAGEKTRDRSVHVVVKQELHG